MEHVGTRHECCEDLVVKSAGNHDVWWAQAAAR